ncbi:uncharacterized protein V6R79_008952 [Siganus canaliculatus]
MSSSPLSPAVFLDAALIFSQDVNQNDSLLLAVARWWRCLSDPAAGPLPQLRTGPSGQIQGVKTTVSESESMTRQTFLYQGCVARPTFRVWFVIVRLTGSGLGVDLCVTCSAFNKVCKINMHFLITHSFIL